LIVVDASVMVAWLLNEPHLSLGDEVYGLLATERIFVPAHWPAEIGNAMVMSIRRGRMSVADQSSMMRRLSTLDLVVQPHAEPAAIDRLVQLAVQEGLTAYDAAYVALARDTGSALATIDREMRASAKRLGVVLLPD
jgi:predicted nucleic acid-binding protein